MKLKESKSSSIFSGLNICSVQTCHTFLIKNLFFAVPSHVEVGSSVDCAVVSFEGSWKLSLKVTFLLSQKLFSLWTFLIVFHVPGSSCWLCGGAIWRKLIAECPSTPNPVPCTISFPVTFHSSKSSQSPFSLWTFFTALPSVETFSLQNIKWVMLKLTNIWRWRSWSSLGTEQ